MSVILPPAILGPEKAVPLLWAPGIFALFLQETVNAHKILVLVWGKRFFSWGGGCVKMKPFVLLAFPLFYSNFWPNSRPIHVARPIVVLWRFPCFIGISGGFGVLEPRIHHLPFVGPKMAFSSSQTLRFKGKMANFEARATVKTAERTPKGQMVPFSRMHGGGGGGSANFIFMAWIFLIYGNWNMAQKRATKSTLIGFALFRLFWRFSQAVLHGVPLTEWQLLR